MAVSNENLPEINILLIGQTGSGKSTTLNALANYLMYGTYEYASKSVDNFSVVVPSKFVLPDPTTGLTRVVESKINIGTKFNERNAPIGTSSTIYPVGYTFVFPGSCLLRIIDTPGMGDTGGVQQDKENLQNIISYLQQFELLHGVVFVIKGNDTRKTTFFNYCFSELMTHLHKSVSRNIMFLFTYSRDSMYGAGSGYETLKSFIENELNIDLDLKLIPNGQKNANGKLQAANCFFIDNEAFRILLATKDDYELPVGFEMFGEFSWNEAVKQISAMMKCLLEIEPHNLRKTISLYNVRKIIMDLAQPMVEFQRKINEDIGKIKTQEEMLHYHNQSLDECRNMLKIKVNELRMVPLEFPATVCTAAKCISTIINEYGDEEIRYTQRCHDKCDCFMVQPNVTDQLSLITCKAMGFEFTTKKIFDFIPYDFDISRNCSECGCNWSVHMHIYAQYERTPRVVIDGIENKILSKEEIIASMERVRNEAKQLVDEMNEELAIIEECNAKFTYVLATNSQLANNKYYKEYLDHLIDQEYEKPNPKIHVLKKMQSDYEKTVRQMKDAIKNKSLPVALDDVPELKKKLLSLKHNGEQLQTILDKNEAALSKRDQSQYDQEVAKVSTSNVFFELFKKKFF